MEVMPLGNRRQQWRLLQRHSEIPLPDLTMPATWYMAVWALVTAGVWPLVPGWGYAVFTGLSAALCIREYSFVQVDFPVTTLGDLAFQLFARSYHKTSGGQMAWAEVRSIVLAGLADCSTEETDVAAAELNEQTQLSF
ncbi:hypothetical protein GCM10022406_22860 [Hymenobacter algoricola]|uniref:Uncharacterized protein n=2 Tax=Hymenobacter algoricola TaxID=486267 RepID=A0ABP7N6A9_9BACT